MYELGPQCSFEKFGLSEKKTARVSILKCNRTQANTNCIDHQQFFQSFERQLGEKLKILSYISNIRTV